MAGIRCLDRLIPIARFLLVPLCSLIHNLDTSATSISALSAHKFNTTLTIIHMFLSSVPSPTHLYFLLFSLHVLGALGHCHRDQSCLCKGWLSPLDTQPSTQITTYFWLERVFFLTRYRLILNKRLETRTSINPLAILGSPPSDAMCLNATDQSVASQWLSGLISWCLFGILPLLADQFTFHMIACSRVNF